MPPTAALSGAPWRVTPGETVEVAVLVRNAGTTVDHLAVDVVGAPAAWTTVVPDVVPLLPGAAGDAVIRFHPPAEGVPAGPVPFGVRVVSQADGSSVVEEGVLELERVAAFGAELRPRTSEGRTGQHVIRVHNRGNTDVEVRVAVDDPDEHLLFRLDRTTVEVGPGATAEVELRVAARRRSGGHRRFQVQVDAVGAAPVVLEGALSAPQVRPGRWPKLAAAAALLAVVALVANQLRGGGDDDGDLVTTKASRLQHTFAVAEADGLRAERTWHYAVDDRLLENELRVTNTAGEARKAVVFEVVPKEVAAHVAALRFDPAPTEVVEDDPVVRYDLPLGPGATAFVRWEVNVATSIGAAGLSSLASRRDAADRTFHESRQPLIQATGAGAGTAVVPPQDTTSTTRAPGRATGGTTTTQPTRPGDGGGVVPPEIGSEEPPPTTPVSRPGEVASVVVQNPQAARVVNGIPEEVRVTVSWSAPTTDGGQPPSIYRIKCTLMEKDSPYTGSASPAPCRGGVVVGSADGSVRSADVVIERVEPGPFTWVKWEVAAENSAGVGPYRDGIVVVPNLVGLYSWEAFPFARAIGLRVGGGAPYDCGRESARICSQSVPAGERPPAGAPFTVREES